MKKLITLFLIFISINSFSQNPLLLKDVAPGNNTGTIQHLVKTSNYTFFNENDGGAATDRSLYRTDGTPGGTIKLNLTYTGYISTKADKLTALGNKVIFAGDNLAPGYGEIWSSDGTQAGTIAIERFMPTIDNRGPVFELAAMNGYVYYGVVADNNKTQIKRTDGTPGGTSIVYEFSSYTTAPEPGIFKVINGILYFNLYDGNGTGIDQLWRSDGTAAGTYLLKDFGPDQFVASWYMPAGNLFYWMIVKPGTGNVLWKSDGTVAGTEELKLIGTTGNNNYPQNIAIGNNLFFAGLDNIGGKELWVTDGTAAGTNMVVDINPGVANSNPANFVFLNNNFYFSATKAGLGTELWKSDGTAVGTSIVKDIFPGAANSNPALIVESNGVLLFRAGNDLTGSELWISDGTAVNTKMVVDLNPSGASNPNFLTPGNPVYFSANNGTSGVEVFKYDNSGNILEIHTKFYVNDNATSGDVFTTAVGNNANAGTKAAPVASISYAVSIAQAGDTIVVDAGTYAGQVLIDKAITIRGAGIGATIINPGNEVPATLPGIPLGVIYSTSGIGDVFIKDVTINSGTPQEAGTQYYGISLQTGGSISGCEINGAGTSSSTGQGIYIQKDDVDPEAISILNNHLHHIGFLSIKINVPHITAVVNNNTIDVTGSVYGMGLVAGGEPYLIDGLVMTGNKLIGFNGFGVKVNSSQPGVIINNNSFEDSPTWQPVMSVQNNGAPPVDASCNWFGTTNAELIKAEIQGNVNYGPWLTNATDNSSDNGFQPLPDVCNGRQNKFYVNDNNQTGDVLTSAVGNNSNNGFSSAPFATINHAMSVAQAGDTIIVDAGTYAERIFVSKSLYFKGAYSGVDPGTSLNRGVSETILLPSTENNLLEIITVQAANVSFDGFLFDGDNPAITGTMVLNGVDVNAGMGIFNGNLQTDNLVVKNNIFKNFFRYGIFLQKTTGTVTGNVISHNHIDNVPSRTPRDGRGVGLFNNAYATVIDNHITRVNTAVLVANINLGSTDSILIASNTIEAYSFGINANVNNGLTSSIVIDNNQVTVSDLAAWSAPGSSIVNNCTGINISGLTISKKVSITNNTVTGARFGFGVSQLNSTDRVFLSNNNVTGAETGITLSSIVTPQGVQVDGSTVSNSSVLGLMYTNSGVGAAKLTLNNVSLINNVVGLDASAGDNNTMQLEFYGVTINGGTTGIRFYGKPISLPANTLSGVSFSNQSKEYILQTYHSFEDQTIDASTVSFDGITPGNMTLAQLFATEDKLTHRIDFDSVGYFKLKPNEVFVTQNSFAPTMPPVWGVATTTPDINRAVAAAVEGDIIHIAAGTYANQVTIDKGLTLIGEGQDATFIVPPALPYAPPPGPFGEKGLIQSTQNIGDVHVLNLSATGDFANNLQGILIQSGGSVKNCKVQNGNQGIYFRVESGLKTAVVENNIINAEYIATNFQGSGLTVSLINNTITASNPGFSSAVFAGLDFGPLPQFIATGNSMSGFSHSGFFGGSLSASITQNSLVGTGPAIWQLSGNQIQASCNWFGTNEAELIKVKMQGNVSYGPWLTSGIDNSSDNGFQPLAGTCGGRQNKFYVNDNNQTGDIFTTAVGNNSNNGFSSAPFATFEYAFSIAQTGDTIYMDAGNYPMADFVLNKAITVLGPNYLVSPNDANDKRLLNVGRNAEATVSGAWFTISSSNISIKGLIFSPGSKSAFSLLNSAGTTNDFRNFQFEKNILKTNAPGSTQLNFNGVVVASPNMPQTSGYIITDNRFEKNDGGTGTTIQFSYLKNITVTDNSFVVTGPTPRTQNTLVLGSAGITDSVVFSNNTVDQANTVVNGPRVANAIIANNKFYNTGTSCTFTNAIAGSSNIEVSGNFMETTSGGGPFIGYNKSGGNLTGSSTTLRAENNIMNGTSSGATGQLFGSFNITVNNSVLNPTIILKGNKITYSGDLSMVESGVVRPIVLRGKIANATVENNEISLNNTAGTLLPAVTGPSNPGITINSEFGSSSFIPSNAVINILNNKVYGFKQSIIIYDGTNGLNPYIGYGNLSTGAILNISNNSFTGDSVSINNGAVGQSVNANCNWYGSASAQVVASKVSNGSVIYSTWLANGTDNDVATGFQPLPGACNGTTVVATLNAATNISCFGANNGAITITISGGTNPYTIEWSKDGNSYSSDEDLANLTPGTYSVNVTDANGSVASITGIFISQPLLLTASADGTNVSCFGGNNGSASVIADGGTAPYTYLWSNGTTTNAISNLVAGIYTVTVTDANGCTAQVSYQVTQPVQLTVILSGTPASCNGSVTATVSGGTLPYTYLWSNGGTTASIINVPAGLYSVTVTDAKNCMVSGSFTITGNSPINPATSLVHVSCFGGSNGSITITGTNTGTAPFTYNLNGSLFQSGNVFNNLAAGVYVVGVKDANGCSDFVSRTINQPAALTVVLDSLRKPCGGTSTGRIYITPSGGSGGKTYSWTGPNGFTSTIQDPNNVAAGNYSVVVTDGNGCTAQLNVVLPEWPPVTITESITHVTCRNELNGAINATISGGTGSGFTYSWNGPGTYSAITKDISGLKSGSYTLSVTDTGSGCVIQKTIVVSQPATVVNVTAARTNITGCDAPGTITATGSGGTAPYEYSLDGGAYQPSNVFNVFVTGIHTVTVRDANGCTKTINAPNITDNGSDDYESLLNSPNANNNNKAKAAPINTGTTVSARIGTSGDVDYYKLGTANLWTGNYTVNFVQPSVAVVFDLVASNGTTIIAPTSSSATYKQYDGLSGTYYVRVSGTNSFNCYQFTVTNGTMTRSSGNNIQPEVTKAKTKDGGILTISGGNIQQEVNKTQMKDGLFDVKVLGNPSSTNFILNVITNSNEKISMRVFDAQGRLIEERQGLQLMEILKVGERYINGMYMAEIRQGKDRKTVRLVKM